MGPIQSLANCTNLLRVSLSSSSTPSLEGLRGSPITAIELTNPTNLTVLPYLPQLRDLTLTSTLMAVPIVLPADMGRLSTLRYLYCFGYMSPFPASMANLTGLQTLKLSNVYGLPVMPSVISNLTGLQTIEIRVLNALPGSLPPARDLPNLKSLSLYGAGIQGIPDLSGSDSLESVVLQALSGVTVFPSTLQGTPNLKFLVIENLPLSLRFPIPLLNVSKLEQLRLASCGVTGSLPASIFNPALTSISLSAVANIAGSVPLQLSQAINLTAISFDNVPGLNGTMEAPVGGFPQLKSITVRSTAISAISPNFGGSPITLVYVLEPCKEPV